MIKTGSKVTQFYSKRSMYLFDIICNGRYPKIEQCICRSDFTDGQADQKLHYLFDYFHHDAVRFFYLNT